MFMTTAYIYYIYDMKTTTNRPQPHRVHIAPLPLLYCICIIPLTYGTINHKDPPAPRIRIPYC